MRSTMRVVTAAFGTLAVLMTTAPAGAAPRQPDGSWRALADVKQAARTPDGKVVLVVRMTTGRDTARVVSAARRISGVALRHELAGAGTASFAVAAADVSRVRSALLAQPGVGSVTLAVPRSFSDFVPNDPGFGDEQMGYYGNVHAPAGWEISRGSADVKIAIIDSGVDVGHEDLIGKVAAGDTWNVVTSARGVRDDIGHGTFVAGVAAAVSDNAKGVTGAGFDTSLIAVKVADAYGEVTSDAVAAGIVWAADRDADIINISLVGASPDPGEAAAIAYAQGLGVLVVAAAGNGGSDRKNYPAAYEGVMAVGATTGQGTVPKRAWFSQRGSWVTVGAPGEHIYSTAPVVESEFFRPSYDTAAGTSFSSPMTAGLAALLMAVNGGASADQVKQAIVAGAEQVDGLDLGAGEIDFVGAFAHLPPTSAPTLTTTGPVSGVVTLTASSTAPKVRFYADGQPLGAAVDVATGTAQSQPWDTFGLANGDHAVKAVDCTVHAECSLTGDDADLAVANGLPVFTAPADPATPVAGDVLLTVTTTAPQVRFFRGSTGLGGPVAVSGGSASLTTSTFGLANGATAYTARQCSVTGVCSPDEGSVSLTVDNAAPTLTSPSADAVVGGLVPVTATGPGGGVAFYVDGVKRATDGAAPYASNINFSALPAGSRSVTVRGCSSDGTSCAGPISAAVSVTNTSLRPGVVVRSPFSPNGDGVRDELRYAITVTEAQRAQVRIVGPGGGVVHGPRNLGVLAAGRHVFTWSGRSSSAAFPDGGYSVQVTTANGGGATARAGWAARSARLDTVRPGLSSVTGGGTFYPRRDGYRDRFNPRVTLSERARLDLVVRDAAGSVVHRGRDARLLGGRRSMTWNGRVDGALAPAGIYTFQFVATDAAGNRRGTARRPVRLSHKRLVDQVEHVQVPAATFFETEEIGCGLADVRESEFDGGVALFTLGCEDENSVRVDYRLPLPRAVVYRSLTIVHLGNAGLSDTPVYAFVRNHRTGALDAAGSVQATRTIDLRAHPAVSATDRVKGGQAEVSVMLRESTTGGLNVYDMGFVGVTVVYAVLV